MLYIQQVNGSARGAPAVPPREAPRDAPPRPPAHEIATLTKYQVSAMNNNEKYNTYM